MSVIIYPTSYHIVFLFLGIIQNIITSNNNTETQGNAGD